PEIAKVGFGLLFEERPGHPLSFVRHLINSIGLGRTTFFACAMGNSFSQNGHLAAIFSLSNWGETRNSLSHPGQITLIELAINSSPHASSGIFDTRSLPT